MNAAAFDPGPVPGGLMQAVWITGRGVASPLGHCDAWIDPVRDAPREVALPAVMSNSFAFGGANAALVLTHV